MSRQITCERSDLEKIFDVLETNYRFHASRDAMNGAVHLATLARLSPLTSETSAALDRLKAILETPAAPQEPPHDG